MEQELFPVSLRSNVARLPSRDPDGTLQIQRRNDKYWSHVEYFFDSEESEDELEPYQILRVRAGYTRHRRRTVREDPPRSSKPPQRMPVTLKLASGTRRGGPVPPLARVWVFTSLLKLEICNTQLESVPAQILNFSNLQKLDLGYNLIRFLPDLGGLSSLKTLTLNHNRLLEIPESICQLRSLRELLIFANQIQFLPEQIGNLVNLRKFFFSSNRIKRLPASIGNLHSLRVMLLGCNELGTICREIGSLASLQELVLHDNKITFLPEEIGNLSELRRLDLIANELSNLPDSIQALRNLRYLSTISNPFVTRPAVLDRIPWSSIDSEPRKYRGRYDR